MFASRVGIAGLRRPALITAIRSVMASSSSRSWLITSTAQPAAARSKIALWIVAAAPASTPQVGCAATSTAGACRISRPMMNFCRLPPDRLPARASGAPPRTSNCATIFCAKSRAAPARTMPPRDRPARSRPVSSVFSASVKLGMAAWPRRSSGTVARPSLRRAAAPIRPHTVAPMRMSPALVARRSPEIAAMSSLWPLPATPAMPTISPARTSRLTSRSGMSCGAAAGRSSA